jgi:hypothetical protein
VGADAELDQLTGLADRHIRDAAWGERGAVSRGDHMPRRDQGPGALEGAIDDDVRDVRIFARTGVVAADDRLGG